MQEVVGALSDLQKSLAPVSAALSEVPPDVVNSTLVSCRVKDAAVAICRAGECA